MDNVNIECQNCKSKKIVKRGSFKTKSQGKRQRYFCKPCNKKFIVQDEFYRMRNSPQKITLCLDLFFKGISTREIQSHLKQFHPHNSSWVSVYNWIIKYSNLIHKKVSKLNLDVGSEVQIDEMEIGKRKSQYNGWFVDSIDSQTRYMISSGFFKSRGFNELNSVVKDVKNRTNGSVKIYTTDGFNVYEKVMRKTIGYYNLKRRKVIHNQVTQLKGEGFNHKIERLHNAIRHRIKTFRGFHGKVQSANSIMKGLEAYYNFIRPHIALKGKTPSELATNVKLKGNKWLDLIEMKN